MIYNWQRTTPQEKREILKQLSPDAIEEVKRVKEIFKQFDAEVYVIELQPEDIKIID